MVHPISPSRSWTRLCAALAWTLAPLCAAQEADPQFQQDPLLQDEEGSRYAHVRHVEGRATLVRAYDGETVTLDLNMPVVPGDRIQAPAGTRLEVRLADSSFLRASGLLGLDIHALAAPRSEDEALTHLSLNQGDLSVEVVGMDRGSERTHQVDTPAGTAYLMTDGLYRIRVDSAQRAIVWVREGVAEVEGKGGTVIIRSGQSTQVVRGQAPADPTTRISRLDEFERWVDERRAATGAASVDEAIARELPDPVQPYAGELSGYGRWETLPTYGPVWVPAVAAPGWYPYYHGYWVDSPIGFVWVSYEPWGWVPYHYGRWQWVVGYGWVWIPGSRFAGAWVVWWPGPSYLAWVPLGYYDRPAIDLHLVFTSGYRPLRHGWACIPYPLFYSRDLPRRYIRDAAVLRTHLAQAVKVHRLTHFRAHDLRTRPGVGAEVFSAARRAAETPPGRRFHTADVRVRPSAARRKAAAARAPRPTGPFSSVRATTLQRGVGASLPPLPSPRGGRIAPDRERDEGPEAERPSAPGQAREAAARAAAPPETAGPERSIRELLHRVGRPVATPGSARGGSERRPAVRPAPSRERPQRPSKPRGESRSSGSRGSSGSQKSRPRGHGRP